jgi:hypothetical protein
MIFVFVLIGKMPRVFSEIIISNKHPNKSKEKNIIVSIEI